MSPAPLKKQLGIDNYKIEAMLRLFNVTKDTQHLLVVETTFVGKTVKDMLFKYLAEKHPDFSVRYNSYSGGVIKINSWDLYIYPMNTGYQIARLQGMHFDTILAWDYFTAEQNTILPVFLKQVPAKIYAKNIPAKNDLFPFMGELTEIPLEHKSITKIY